MFIGTLKRWLILALCIVGLYYLWPVLSCRVYEPRIHCPLAQIRLGAR